MKHSITKYFSIKEFVSASVYKKMGENAWALFDTRLLDVVVWLREGIGIPLVCNNWASGGQYQQRGYRENVCQIVSDKTKKGQLYLSAHTNGKGVDLSSGKRNAKEIRKWIREHIDSCPWPIRLEDDKSAISWVHIDVMTDGEKKLVEFSA